MKFYKYKARDLTGSISKGTISGKNVDEIKVQLMKEKGLIVLDLAPTNAGVLNQSFSFGKAVKEKEIQIFTRQLSVLVNAGIPLEEALETIKSIIFNQKFKSAIEDVIERIRKGAKFSQALSFYNRIFDTIYVNLIRAGEEGGNLDVSLDRLAKHIEISVHIKSKIKGAMTYPIAILSISFIVLAIILAYVVPSMASMFSKSGNELPALTSFVIALSDNFKAYWYLYVGGVIGFVFLLKFLARNPVTKRSFDFFLLKVPVFGDLIRRSAVAQSARTLETMIRSGVPLLDSIDSVIPTIDNEVLKEVFENSKKHLTKGGQMNTAFHESPQIPHMAASMIAIGEKSGNIDTLLSKCADFYEKEVEVTVESILKLIEPALIVVLGGLVGFIVVAMYLPVFKLSSTIGG